MQNPWIVVKFGGTSVKDRACWDNIATIINNHIAAGKHPLVVCSAPSQVSDKLEQLIEAAVQKNYSDLLQEINEIYRNLAQTLSVHSELLVKDFSCLQQLCEGISLLGEASPRVWAKIMSFGELLLTRLGYEFLCKQNIDINWQNARELLVSKDVFGSNQADYLTAICSDQYDAELDSKLRNLTTNAIITQGFIARNQHGETVLLGRGGSDTSAAYFSVKLNASACEIWTDVAGLYTANPYVIPEARLLKKLDYAEAQEIASAGANVLHPNSIPLLQVNNIPLHVKLTQQPGKEGTLITAEGDNNILPIKSIIIQYHVLLISIDTISMWKQAGFLADVFGVFKQHGLSVDLISTSESNVTVSLDHLILSDNNRALDALLAELNGISNAKPIGPCASISLIGHNIRSVLPHTSYLFEVFAAQKIHLLSLASNDLNLTFVVDEDQAERLAKKLHVMLIEQNPNALFIGKSWFEEYCDVKKLEIPWWQQQPEALLQIASEQSPVYVYYEAVINAAAERLQACDQIGQIFYAMKANPNPDILRSLFQLGLGFECVSLQEVKYLLELLPDLQPQYILFTPNFAPKDEYKVALDLGVNVIVDNIYPLKFWPELFANRNILIRIDPGYGEGHHKYVCTGGTESKFGIPLNDLPIVADIATENNMHIIGLHAHSGSGILQADAWQQLALTLTSCLEYFPEVKIINLGGGLGVVEKPGQQPLSLISVNDSLKHVKIAYPKLQIWLEPGRYLVASAGVLLARVTQVKHKGDVNFVGIETGMNSLIRPALYGSYHEIVNLSKLDAPKTMLANIVGPICETGDVLGYSRLLPVTEEGDVLLIATTGAYGHCMSSSYNMRQPAIEYFLNTE